MGQPTACPSHTPVCGPSQRQQPLRLQQKKGKLLGTRLIDGRLKSKDFAINKKHQCQRASRSYRVIAMKHNELARIEDNGAHGKSPENYFVLDLRIATQRMPSVFASAASSNPDQLTFGQALSAGEAGSRGRNSLQGIGAKPAQRPGREWPDSGLPDHSPATLAQAERKSSKAFQLRSMHCVPDTLERTSEFFTPEPGAVNTFNWWQTARCFRPSSRENALCSDMRSSSSSKSSPCRKARGTQIEKEKDCCRTWMLIIGSSHFGGVSPKKGGT